MTERRLQNCIVLVAEDDYFLAKEAEQELSEAGAVVVGPVASVEDAVALIDQTPSLDAAVLDVNLRGMMVFPAADRLTVQKVPFVFVTGYSEQAIPARYQQVPRLEKPTESQTLVRTLARLVSATSADRADDAASFNHRA